MSYSIDKENHLIYTYNGDEYFVVYNYGYTSNLPRHINYLPGHNLLTSKDFNCETTFRVANINAKHKKYLSDWIESGKIIQLDCFGDKMFCCDYIYKQFKSYINSPLFLYRWEAIVKAVPYNYRKKVFDSDEDKLIYNIINSGNEEAVLTNLKAMIKKIRYS